MPPLDYRKMMHGKDWGSYVLGAFLGIAAGVLTVKLGDLLFTALLVLAFTMLMGLLSPEQPWRWTLVVAVFVPLMQLLAYLVLTEKPYRAQIYESFLAFFPGVAGAYAGAFARMGVRELFGKK
jgi:cell division protein FtsW (lipid II flippase)